MKLYATVASERATKGQGGNEFICIKLTVQNGSKQNYPIGEIILDYNDDIKNHGVSQNEWVLKWLAQDKYDAEIIAQGNVEPIVGQRRFVFCEKAQCEVEQEYTGTDWLCLHDGKQKGKSQKGERCEHCGGTIDHTDIGCYCKFCGKLIAHRI